MHLLTLYFLDSGAYSQGFYDWFGWFTGTEYDWIHRVSSSMNYSAPLAHDNTAVGSD